MEMYYVQHRSYWPLRISVLLFVIGTVKFVARDAFHADESIVQPIVEISSVVLAVAFSARSWDPLLSVTRSGLLILISISTVALLRIYGLKRLVSQLLNAYM